MGLLFFDGLQDPILMAKPEWKPDNLWGGTAAGRDGQANGAASATNTSGRVLVLPSSAATCIVGCAFNLGASALGGTSLILAGFCSDTTTPTVQLVVTVSAGGFLEVRRTSATGTLLGTSSGHAPIPYSVWHHLGAKAVLNSAGAGSITLQLNGVTVLTLSGITTSSVTGNVAGVMWKTGVGGFGVVFDDIYVCDAVDATATQGRANNDFLGDVRVQTLLPTAAGDTTQWTPSAGANYAAVDENPANTTDYVSSSVAAQRDLYNMADLAGSIVNVYGVRTGYYATKSDAGTATLKPTIKETGGTVTVDAAQAPSFGSWGPIWSSYKWVKPSNSGLWAAADINALQVGQDNG